MSRTTNIILFDDSCVLCNWAVRFLLKHNGSYSIKFAPLGSEQGKSLLREYDPQEIASDSVILIQDNRCYTRSSAVLKASKELDFPWSLLQFFVFVPKFIRDGIYNAIAQNRHRFLGRNNACKVLPTDIKGRIIQ